MFPLTPSFIETQNFGEMTPTTAHDTTRFHFVSNQPSRHKVYYTHGNTQYFKGLLAAMFTITASALTTAHSTRDEEHSLLLLTHSHARSPTALKSRSLRSRATSQGRAEACTPRGHAAPGPGYEREPELQSPSPPINTASPRPLPPGPRGVLTKQPPIPPINSTPALTRACASASRGVGLRMRLAAGPLPGLR